MDRGLRVDALLQLIDGPVSRAEARRSADRPLHEIVRTLNSVAERHSRAEAAGNGGCERATGAVRISRVEALGDIGARVRVWREQQVRYRVAAAMTALDENRLRSERK